MPTTVTEGAKQDSKMLKVESMQRFSGKMPLILYAMAHNQCSMVPLGNVSVPLPQVTMGVVSR